MLFKRPLGILTLAAVVALPLAALAQDHGPGPGPGPGRGPGGDEPGHHQRHCADMAAHADARLAFLHTKLAITAAQEGAFTTFATAIRQSVQPMAAACTAGPPPRSATFPERVDAHLKMMATHAQTAQAVATAAKTLYGALNADQKKIMDDMPPMMLHHRG